MERSHRNDRSLPQHSDRPRSEQWPPLFHRELKMMLYACPQSPISNFSASKLVVGLTRIRAGRPTPEQRAACPHLRPNFDAEDSRTEPGPDQATPAVWG